MTNSTNLQFTESLQKRFSNYAKNIYLLIKKSPKDRISIEYLDQLNRCSCSVGANYIEAVEGESKKDFYHRIKICKKEAKESQYWLDLLKHSNPELSSEIISKLKTN